MTNKTFEVVSPIRCNGVRYDAGAVADDLPGEFVDQLLASGAIAPIDGNAPPKPGADAGEGDGSGEGGETNKVTAPTDPAERLEAVKVAIQNLDPEDEAAFTKDGAPKVPAIEAALGWNISGEERNQAVEALKAAAES